jgi:ParB/RepB/Spo0J family partition protein
MTKHILADVPGFVKPKSDAFEFDPRHIVIVSGWNHRTDFSGQDELKASIIDEGVKVALIVKKTADKTIELVAGERRLRATLEAIEEGHDIRSVPVRVLSSKVSEIDAYMDSVSENMGSKPLEPVEQANAFRQLVKWGVNIQEIATKFCCSVSHVRNRLELADAAPVVKSAVADKSITAQDALKIVKDSGGKVEAQTNATEEIQTAPRAPRPAILRINIEHGHIRTKSKNGETCAPLVNVLSGNLMAQIEAAGYDPQTLKISICKS